MTLSEVEAALHAALTEEAQHFAHALRLADTLPELIREGKDATEIAGEIDDALVEAARIDAEVAVHRQQWLQAHTPPSEAVRQAGERLTDLSRKLHECLVTAEGEARARQSAIEPRLDTLVRTVRMRKAYGEVPRQSSEVAAIEAFKR